MPKHSATMAIAENIAKTMIANQTAARLHIAQDAAILAANRALHLGKKRAADFIFQYENALDELATEYIRDHLENKDKSIEFAKGTRDTLIKSIVGEENFTAFDTAYTDAYVDELRRIRCRDNHVYLHVNCKLPEEPMDALAKTATGYAIVRWDGKAFMVMGKTPRVLEGVVKWMPLPKDE